MIGKDKKAKAITPFDKESVENLNEMSFKIDPKREINIIDKEFGKMRFIE